MDWAPCLQPAAAGGYIRRLAACSKLLALIARAVSHHLPLPRLFPCSRHSPRRLLLAHLVLDDPGYDNLDRLTIVLAALGRTGNAVRRKPMKWGTTRISTPGDSMRRHTIVSLASGAVPSGPTGRCPSAAFPPGSGRRGRRPWPGTWRPGSGATSRAWSSAPGWRGPKTSRRSRFPVPPPPGRSGPSGSPARTDVGSWLNPTPGSRAVRRWIRFR